MIELGQTVATGIVGVAAVAVAVWGAWISVGSSRKGPNWALSQLETWKPASPVLLILGGIAAVLMEPSWVGLGVVYIGAVTWWLTATVRRGLIRTREVYGGLDGGAAPTSGSTGGYSRLLLGGAAVLAVLSVWDIFNRGWPGIFGLLLAMSLGYVGTQAFRA